MHFVMQATPSLNRYSAMPMETYLNVGTDKDVSICDLAETITGVVGFSGELHFDASKTDGTPRKLLDISRLKKMGWKAEIPPATGTQIYIRMVQRTG